MNALNSPLEALAFNYISFGFLKVVNIIWTWVSFWRIRDPPEHAHGKTMHGSSQSQLLVSVEKETPVKPAQSISCTKTVSFCSLDGEGSTKGKFTVYYCNEGESEKCGRGYDGEVNGDDNGGEVGEEWWSKWEMVMKMRKGDDEWYRNQVMTRLNGNVVRLWDGCRRRRNEETPLDMAVVGDFKWW